METIADDYGLGSRTIESHHRAEPTLHPIAALVLGFWYSLAASGALSKGFLFLHRHHPDSYLWLEELTICLGPLIGTSLAVTLVKSRAFLVGISSALISPGCLLALTLLYQERDSNPEQSPIEWLTPAHFMLAILILSIVCGLLGSLIGIRVRKVLDSPGSGYGIKGAHWFWLWLPVYGWVLMAPECIYYLWLQIVSFGYVLIHPSLWLGELWTASWTLFFGMSGIRVFIYGIHICLKAISTSLSGGEKRSRRIMTFLFGDLILAGLVSNILLVLAITHIEHLADGLTTDPWWILLK